VIAKVFRTQHISKEMHESETFGPINWWFSWAQGWVHRMLKRMRSHHFFRRDKWPAWSPLLPLGRMTCLLWTGFFCPIGQAEPPWSGTGISGRFNREPTKAGWIQISIQIPSSIGLDMYNDSFDRYTGPVRPVNGHWKKLNQWEFDVFSNLN
jgi:hypothetical protein